MPDDEENIDPSGNILSEARDEALNYDSDIDADGTRDAWWLRWLKFISIIAVLAIIFGLAFMLEGYVTSNNHSSASFYHYAGTDTMNAIKHRLWLGAAVGGGLGLIYVIRCLVQKKDLKYTHSAPS